MDLEAIRIKKQYERGIITCEQATLKTIDLLSKTEIVSQAELDPICEMVNDAEIKFTNTVRDMICACTIMEPDTLTGIKPYYSNRENTISKQEAMDGIIDGDNKRLAIYARAWNQISVLINRSPVERGRGVEVRIYSLRAGNMRNE